jgi:polyisoprenoid-binding protein YceI
MKKTNSLFVLMLFATIGFAQKKTTTSAIIGFDATTAIDALPKAENKTVIAAIDPAKGTVQFEAIIKNFDFSNPRIQDHFNQKGWMNSDEFPKATFSGTITNLSAVNFKKDGTYTANVAGDLSIHGQTQKITTDAVIIVAGSGIKATSSFSIKLADYGVSGAQVLSGKVSNEPKITVSAEFN